MGLLRAKKTVENPVEGSRVESFYDAPSSARWESSQYLRGPRQSDAKALAGISLLACIASGFLLIASLSIGENTIGWERLVSRCSLLGVVTVGLPLCWLFRDRRFYGTQFIAERCFVWIFLNTFAVLNFSNAGVIMNFCGGDKTVHNMTVELLGFEWKSRAGHVLYFKAPGMPKQTVPVDDGEYKYFKDKDAATFKVRGGLFGFPVIVDRNPTNQISGK